MFVHTEVGNCGLVITVPHDGDIRISEAPTRCETQRWAQEGGPDPRDEGTMAFALCCRDALMALGFQPTLVWFTIHRSHVDVNRSPRYEPYATGFHEPYEQFHQALDGEIASVVARFKRSLLLDVHGYITSPGPEEYDIVLGTNQHQTCPRGTDVTFATALHACENAALGRSYRVVFSPDHEKHVTSRYRGGWIVRRTSNRWGAFGLESIQIELSKEVRLTHASYEAAQHIASVMRSFLPIHV